MKVPFWHPPLLFILTGHEPALAQSLPADLFPFEKIQLLKSDLAALPHDFAKLVSFENANHIGKATGQSKPDCKLFPGDPNWPVDSVWDALNSSMGGSLIKTVPIAAPCYNGPFYDQARCEYVTDNWTNSTMHELDPTSMMSVLYEGETCQPTSNPNGACTLGGYPVYAVNVTNVKQIQLAVNFARSQDIRFVIKNTGHDFAGKSGGAGALSVWTHYLDDILYIPEYTDEAIGYSGPAFKVGSGVIARDIYAAAEKEGVIVAAGEGADVGVFGGYLQGGGHGPMVSMYGLAIDQVLSMEVVTADGGFVTANSTSNVDLFWALCGGGGSTWGVVTSVTVRAHPSTPASVAVFSLSPSKTTSVDAFWQAVRAYWERLPTYADAGVYSYFFIFPFGGGFTMTFFRPNGTVVEVSTLLASFLADLKALNITEIPTYNEYPSFYPAWEASFPLEAAGVGNLFIGSRLFPRSNWANGSIINDTFSAYSDSAKAGSILIGMNCAAPNVWNVSNAGLPAWRDSVLHSMEGFQAPDGANLTAKLAARQLTTAHQARWKALTPDSGSYLNEGDAEEVDFQENFYGANYQRLLEVKRKWDPKNVFWAKTAVGSEMASLKSATGYWDGNGKLCYT